jgi:hypothetical protein
MVLGEDGGEGAVEVGGDGFDSVFDFIGAFVWGYFFFSDGFADVSG